MACMTSLTYPALLICLSESICIRQTDPQQCNVPKVACISHAMRKIIETALAKYGEKLFQLAYKENI